MSEVEVLLRDSEKVAENAKNGDSHASNRGQCAKDGVKIFFEREADRFHSYYLPPEDMKGRVIHYLFHRVLWERFHLTLRLLGDLKGKKILDAGCGPGNYLIALLEQGAGEVAGVDFSCEMIECARGNLEQAGFAARSVLYPADFMSMKLPHTYDHVVAIGFLEYMQDPLAVLQKIRDLADSSFVISFPKMWTLRTLPRMARYKLRNCYLRFFTHRELRGFMEVLNIDRYQIHDLGRDYLVQAWK
ncbi:class I SAM-dependent methyltransferase [Elusimicrobiota bacterium]